MQFRKELAKTLKRELDLCYTALSNLEKKLQQFETKYSMSTEEFNEKFEKGLLGDDQDFFEWNAYVQYYRDWQVRKQALEEISS